MVTLKYLTLYKFDFLFFGNRLGITLIVSIINRDHNNEITDWIIDEFEIKGFVTEEYAKLYLTQKLY